MKGFDRKDLLFSLCGLNCGLCSMRLGGYCPAAAGVRGIKPAPLQDAALHTARWNTAVNVWSIPVSGMKMHRSTMALLPGKTNAKTCKRQ